MTSENNSIDALKLKIIVRQSCLNFGAVETAKKLSQSPEKLEVLLNLLITEDLAESAYLLGKKFLGEEAFATFSEKSEFKDV
jgi:3'-5' exonuclease